MAGVFFSWIDLWWKMIASNSETEPRYCRSEVRKHLDSGHPALLKNISTARINFDISVEDLPEFFFTKLPAIFEGTIGLTPGEDVLGLCIVHVVRAWRQGGHQSVPSLGHQANIYIIQQVQD